MNYTDIKNRHNESCDLIKMTILYSFYNIELLNNSHRTYETTVVGLQGGLKLLQTSVQWSESHSNTFKPQEAVSCY